MNLYWKSISDLVHGFATKVNDHITQCKSGMSCWKFFIHLFTLITKRITRSLYRSLLEIKKSNKDHKYLVKYYLLYKR